MSSPGPSKRKRSLGDEGRLFEFRLAPELSPSPGPSADAVALSKATTSEDFDMDPLTAMASIGLAQTYTNANINSGGGHVGSFNNIQITMSGAQQKLFALLQPVADAAYDSFARKREGASGCLEDTRVDVLRIIDNWTHSESFIFWLNGAAGTGKSTIAQSVAMRYLKKPGLGASFFFSRDQQERRQTRYLIQTIAFQIGNSYPHLKEEIVKVLEDSSILTSNLERQLRELILQPISAIQTTLLSPIIIVLDAVDECEEEEEVSDIIKLLISALRGRQVWIKVIITSRPESYIRYAFTSSGETHGLLVLHDIAPADVQRDIQCFVHHELKAIEQARRELKIKFRESDVDALVVMAAGLFIIAATALKFVALRKTYDPVARLQMVLNSQDSSSTTTTSTIFRNLDRLYRRILEQAVDDQEDGEPLRKILGAILLSFARLSVKDLSRLLELGEVDLRFKLEELHSVIYIPSEDQPEGVIRVFHASFYDYLTSQARCVPPKCFIDRSYHHSQMVRFCLSQLGTLTRDPCHIRDISKLNKQVVDLHDRMAKFLPGDLQYACRHWSGHLSRCELDGPLLELVQGFAFSSILYWVEALSLMGELDRGLECLKEAQVKISPENPSLPGFEPLLELLLDTERFLFDFYDVIELSASHIYQSALPFSPHHSLLYRTWEHELKDSPEILLGVRDHWDACLRVIQRSSPIVAVAVSQDGSRAASASSDGMVYLWDARTGVISHKLEGHYACVNSITISHDGARVISGSDDQAICVWDARSGVVLHKLEGHLAMIRSVAVSSDGTRIVSASDDAIIVIWHAETAEPLRKLEGHSGVVNSVSISADGTCVVSGSEDRTIRMWDTETGLGLQMIEWHSAGVTSVAISRDGTLVVSGSNDKFTCLWDAKPNAPVSANDGRLALAARSDRGTRMISGSGTAMVNIWDDKTDVVFRPRRISHPVNSVKISYDGTQVFSGSDDATIRIWDAIKGDALHTLRGHSGPINSIAIPRDGLRVLSGSDDNTIRIWDAKSALNPVDKQPAQLTSIAISHDGARVISGSNDATVCIWNRKTGVALHTLKGHGAKVSSVAMSNDRTRLVSGSDDATVRLWNAKTGKELHKFERMSFIPVTAVAISHDCLCVVSGATDATIRIWYVKTGELKRKINRKVHSKPIISVALSDKGNCIVSCSNEATVCVWDGNSGLQPRRGGILRGSSDNVKFNSVDISRRGDRIVAGSDDKKIRIWKFGQQAPLHELELGFSPMVHSVKLTEYPNHVRCNGRIIPISSQNSPSPSRESFHLEDGWITTVDRQNRLCWLPPVYRSPSAGDIISSAPLVAAGLPNGALFKLKYDVEEGSQASSEDEGDSHHHRST